jgi:chitodextrinase/mono/diheme cytochrome c family protein
VIFSAEGSWIFPAGTVFIKHFEAPIDANNPSAIKRLETRFLVCTPGGGKYGFTYKWNPAGTDAELLEGSINEPYDYTDSLGTTESRVWSYPSRGDCMVCHNDVSGQALGVKTAHLNSDLYYPLTGRTANQLETLNALGVFSTTLSVTDLENYIEARALDDESAPLEHRVRSYLDTNCSHCHQPGAQGGGFDARISTPLDLQNLINAIPQRYEELGPNGRYIKPGNTALSAIHVRTDAVGNGDAMPPLAKNMAHGEGVEALEDYIESLTQAEFAPPLGAGPQARYVRLKSITGRSRFAAVAEFSILDGNGTTIPFSQITTSYLRENGSGGFVAGISATGAAPSEAADGDLGSSTNFWQSFKAPSGQPNSATPNHPHYLVFELPLLTEIGGFKYYPRTNSQDGRIYQYAVEYSADGISWTTLDSGVWPNVATPFEFKPGYNKRPARTSIAGPAGSLPKPFDMTVVFDMDVTDFTPADLQVTGGSVTYLRGSGYYYVATVMPAPGATTVSVGVTQNSVTSSQGQGNYAASSAQVAILPDTIAPDSPPNLQAIPDLQSVSLSWNESPDNIGTTAYEILRNGNLQATIAGTTYEDAGLEPGTPHGYSIIALDAAGNRSTASTISTATLPDLDPPDAPSELTGAPAVSSILLSWNIPDDNVGVDEYRIWRNNVVIATVQSPSYLDQGLEPSTSHEYRVVALDEAANASEPALLAVATLADETAPSSPDGFAATPSLLSISLTWSASTDDVSVAGYEVWRGATLLGTVTVPSYQDTGLVPGTPYSYSVIAFDAADNASAPVTLNTATLPDEGAPTPPVGLTAAPSYYSIELTWASATDTVGVTGYDIYRGAAFLGTTTLLQFIDTGLDAGTAYTYQVFAKDAAGNLSSAAPLATVTLGFEDWLAEYGLDGQGPTTDSDGGGLDNLTEFQFAFDPRNPTDDLTFRLECIPQGGDMLIRYPELKPVGNFHLHMSASLHDLMNPGSRIGTLTSSQIEAMAPAMRSNYSVVVPSPGTRAFFTLVFEPLPN